LRENTCAEGANSKMSFASGRLYIQRHFDSESKKQASEMIENIRLQFKQNVQRLDWMDEKSKEAVLTKADSIDPKIGYPNWILNNTALDEYYANYDLNEMTYLENIVRISEANLNEKLDDLRKENDVGRWVSGPGVVNAYYSPTQNSITFPAGILQHPFYDSGVPKYLNYGGIGFVVGHEITHGFDDNGRMYDKNGVFYSDSEEGLWSKFTIDQFKKKKQCIVDQYSNFFVEQVNEFMNGDLTQGESIADNGGFKQSYNAYKKWVKENGEEPLLPGIKYNQDQLYFINFGQIWCTKWRDESLYQQILNGVHPPSEFRIIGTTSNYDQFAKVFNCKAGQRNNPKTKCNVW
jgi:neprilysin